MRVDAFMFSGEVDLLDLRLKMLDEYVDRFVIGEAEITFSGHAKPLYFEREKDRYAQFLHKIEYVVVKNFYSPYVLNYMRSMHDMTVTSYPFLMAFYQKEYLQAGMQDLKDKDTVYYGDCDEIWTPQELHDTPKRLEQLSYSYALNMRTSEQWKGTIITDYKHVKDFGLNQLRQRTVETLPNGGWHFSNMGGLEEVRRKVNSYDHQEVNNDEFAQKIEERFTNGQDFLGRENKLFLDESQWPEYLTAHKEDYKHLCRN